MAVADAMFIFEVVVQHVKSLLAESKLVIRGEFADIFSLELKDPKQMHIVMPEPLPLPPEPPGKKGKKKKKKPKPPKRKKKKGKAALPPPPPPEPIIQSGQSVLFTSSAEFLIKLMEKSPLQVTLFNKEDKLVYIGASVIPWDPIFLTYLNEIVKCRTPLPVTLNDEFNVFEENSAKLMAKIGLQIKLSFLGEKVTTAFRTLSEDPNGKKYLYTGINSKTTSYVCSYKTTDEVFEENCNKVENSFIKDVPKPITFADYKNDIGANLIEFTDGDYCCMQNADDPPKSKYTPPNTVPTIDFIIEYVRKVVASCNDNMRMLTPRPTIRPKVRATDIDRLCYCKESQWPPGTLAQIYKNEVQSGPCAVCAEAIKKADERRGPNFDIANIRGPCGKPDCKIARHIKKYIQTLIDEDNVEININDIVGPCGSNICTLAEKIQEFLRQEGVFSEGSTVEALSTQCACMQRMQEALTDKQSCESICSKDCESADSDDSEDTCLGKGCPFQRTTQPLVYNVYYFTVEQGFPTSQNSGTEPTSEKSSGKSSPIIEEDPKFKYCAKDCPSMLSATQAPFCTSDVCPSAKKDKPCPEHPCPTRGAFPPSPADSHIEIDLDAINNPCCSKTCDVADVVKDFIVKGLSDKKLKAADDNDSCYCDCVCDFNFTKDTSYCAVCGGYESLGTDMENAPAYIKPLPCPVYHKLYDKKYIVTENLWPEDSTLTNKVDTVSIKTTTSQRTARKKTSSIEEADGSEKVRSKTHKVKKKSRRSLAAIAKVRDAAPEKKPLKYPYPAVPANMGWNWTAEDIPGMKPRPNWKPGAAIKSLVRRYRAAQEGVDIMAKKKRALLQKKKKVEMKPLLLVTKKDGEYTVQMEVFKKYSKERMLHQYPYEEKQPLVYTIGKTEEEKKKIQKQRERRERRETRRKSKILQSTFRDRCQEICVKAYNQAIGLLPLPNPNDPNCPCHTEPLDDYSPVIDSCSCSEPESLSSSDTDGDDWIIEFKPPAARYDAKAKHPPIMAENESQYTYLDYKVKVLDQQGNQVQRYFKGPDGKEECSDLGGFWGPNRVWLEINKDGYIGPDGRWIPLSFIGPDGLQYSSEEGVFTDKDGVTLKLGVDGYVDKDGKWAWYSKTKHNDNITTSTNGQDKKTQGKVNSASVAKAQMATKPACKNEKDSKPKSQNKKDAKRPSFEKEQSKLNKNINVMNFSTNHNKPNARRSRRTAVRPPHQPYHVLAAEERKMAKYKEIMKCLSMYADIGMLKNNTNRTIKTNRACNTPPTRRRLQESCYYECPQNMCYTDALCTFTEDTD